MSDPTPPEAGGTLDGAARGVKHRAKVWNEGVKLAATFVNAGAIGVLIFSIVRPYFEATSPPFLSGLGASLLIHLVAQAILRAMKDEERP